MKNSNQGCYTFRTMKFPTFPGVFYENFNLVGAGYGKTKINIASLGNMKMFTHEDLMLKHTNFEHLFKNRQSYLPH